MPRPPEPPSVQLSKTLAYLLRHGAQAHQLPLRPDGFVPLSAVLALPRVSKIRLPGPGADAHPGPGADAAAAVPARGPDASHAPTEEDVRVLVAADSKQRYELAQEELGAPEPDAERRRVWLIRAVQGHSLRQVDAVAMKPLTQANLGACLAVASPVPPGAPPSVQACAPRYTLLHGTTADAWAAIHATGGLLTMNRNHIHLAKGLPSDGGVVSGMRSSATVLVHVDPERVLAQGIELFEASNGAVLSPGAPYAPPSPPEEDARSPPQPGDKSSEQQAAQSRSPGGEPEEQGQRKFPPRRRHPQGKKAKAQRHGQQQGILPLTCVAYVQLARTGEVLWPAADQANETTTGG